MQKLEKDIGHLSVLSDELRRRMYLYVREQTGPVTREDVARAMGLSRKLAAFHLDKLAEEGLLEFQYKRPPGRSGPGAGRPAKQYRVSDMELEVSLPERRYDLVGDCLWTRFKVRRPGRPHGFTPSTLHERLGWNSVRRSGKNGGFALQARTVLLPWLLTSSQTMASSLAG
jgi:DNA-binding transcriptional ArsR family regulator